MQSMPFQLVWVPFTHSDEMMFKRQVELMPCLSIPLENKAEREAMVKAYGIEKYLEITKQTYPVLVVKHGMTGNLIYNQAAGAMTGNAKTPAVAPAAGAAAASAPAVAEAPKSA